MPRLTYYVQGTYNAQCDECGRGFKFYDLRKRWDDAWTCSECWEPRHPQDFVRGVKDNSSVPIGKPRLGVPTGLSFWINNWTTPVLFTNNSGDNLTWTLS